MALCDVCLHVVSDGINADDGSLDFKTHITVNCRSEQSDEQRRRDCLICSHRHGKGLSPVFEDTRVSVFRDASPARPSLDYLQFEVSQDITHRSIPFMVSNGIPETEYYLADSSRQSMWTGSDECLELAKFWMHSCISNHSICSPQRTTNFCPRRLLDVSKLPRVRLIEASNRHLCEPYMTLSHCWGSEKFEVLTGQNRTEFEAGVDLSRFPQSFVDAIKVAEKLGSFYVWIDCYCIIQDSLSGEHLADKMTDIAQMADIYSNSILNISCLHASNPNEGCFVSRKGCSPLLPRNFFPILQSSRLSQREYRVFHLGDAIEEQLSIGTSALLERAWVLQEMRLCPRMLGFGRNTMFWRCKGLGLASELLLGGDRILPPMDQELFALDDESYSDIRLLASWLRTVQIYSGMQLSHPREDKLSAIGGIAKVAAERLRDDYSGGIFGRNIIKQLCWSVRSYQTVRPQSRSAQEWRAPSWSWASIDGRVEFCIDTPEKLAGSTDMATGCEAKMEFTDPHNPYGSIKSASLELSGLLIPVNIGVMNGANGNLSRQKERSSPNNVDDAADNSMYFAELPVFAISPSDDRITNIDVDDLEKLRDEAPYSQYSELGRRWYFMPIALEEASAEYLHCLLLEQLSPRTYVRRGFSSLMQEKHQGIMELWREYLANELKEKLILV